jgi:hypothetical protein
MMPDIVKRPEPEALQAVIQSVTWTPSGKHATTHKPVHGWYSVLVYRAVAIRLII